MQLSVLLAALGAWALLAPAGALELAIYPRDPPAGFLASDWEAMTPRPPNTLFSSSDTLLSGRADGEQTGIATEPARHGAPFSSLTRLYEKRACAVGYGTCADGSCCPLTGDCCRSGGCCGSGYWCFSTGCCRLSELGCDNKVRVSAWRDVCGC